MLGGDVPTAAADRLRGAGGFTPIPAGLRGTALIAVVKDILVYATVLAAIIIIPIELGGYGKIFASIDPKHAAAGARHGRTIWARALPMSSLALGSAAGAVPLSRIR